MGIPRDRRDAVIAGMRGAVEAAQHLIAPDSTRIDPFEAVVKAGAFLMFQPLESLFGVYLPKEDIGGDTPGVLVNSKHPLNLQRYTAAHELGHLWMKHRRSLDGGSEIGGFDAEDELAALPRSGPSNEPIEIAAEVFAAYFLMPVNRVLPRINDLGLTSQDLRDPTQVYSLALSFGVSYRAMVEHLASLKKISRNAATELKHRPLKQVKRQLLGTNASADWHCDVWSLGFGESGQVLHARVGDEFAIRLPSHASGGYLWEASEIDRGFELVAIEQLPDRVAHDMRLARVRLTSSGRHRLLLTERRPWSSAEPPAVGFDLEVVAQNQPPVGVAAAIRREMTHG